MVAGMAGVEVVLETDPKSQVHTQCGIGRSFQVSLFLDQDSMTHVY
jgi:hypothetical protein